MEDACAGKLRFRPPSQAAALVTATALTVAGCGSTEGTPEAAASSTAASSTASATSTANETETTVASSPPPQSNTRTNASTTATTTAIPASGPCLDVGSSLVTDAHRHAGHRHQRGAIGYRDPRAKNRSGIVLTCSGFRWTATASAMRLTSHTSCSSTTEHTWARLPVSRTRTHTSSTATRIRYPSNTVGCWTTMHSACPQGGPNIVNFHVERQRRGCRRPVPALLNLPGSE